MTAKIEFFYTHGHSYTATNVREGSISYDKDEVSYVSVSQKEPFDIEILSTVTVQKYDLKFAIVSYSSDSVHAGCTTVIHGLVDKFDIMATFAEADKILKLEEQQRNAKAKFEFGQKREAEKFVERRRKRSQERKESITSK